MRFVIALVAALAGLGLVNADLHDQATSDGTESATQHGILASSMQDYLNQISQLEITEPTVAIPGEWLTDAKKSFIFLPIRVPKNLPLNEVKLLTDGRSVLVNVVERPVEQPEDEATKKFRLILDSFKDQTKGNEANLIAKLQEWQNDEDDLKVQQLISETLATLKNADEPTKVPRTLTIPLNTLELGSVRQKIAHSHEVYTRKAIKKEVAKTVTGIRIANPHGGTATIKLRSTYLQQDATTKETGYGDDGGFGSQEPNLITIPLDSQFLQKLVEDADYVTPLKDKDAFASESSDAHEDKAYIKESFSISLPYPTPTGRIFAVLQSSGQIVVCMPYEKGIKAKSQAFMRVPVFDMQGKKLVGEGSTSGDLSPETSESSVKNAPGAPGLTSLKLKAKKVAAKDAVASPSSVEAKKVVGAAKALEHLKALGL